MYKINPCVADIKLNEENICDLCQKKIIDLNTYSESEVIAMNVNTPSGICGIGSISRMNTAYYLHPFRRFALAILVVFGSSVFILDAKAQDTIQQIQKNILIQNPSDSLNETVIIGKVLDEESREELPFASVWIDINGIKYGAMTDFDGVFKINIKDHTIPEDVTINIAYIPYEKYTSAILLKKGESLNLGNIYIKERTELSGDVIIVGKIPLIDMDPDAHRKTTLKSNEIKRIPRND